MCFFLIHLLPKRLDASCYFSDEFFALVLNIHQCAHIRLWQERQEYYDVSVKTVAL